VPSAFLASLRPRVQATGFQHPEKKNLAKDLSTYFLTFLGLNIFLLVKHLYKINSTFFSIICKIYKSFSFSVSFVSSTLMVRYQVLYLVYKYMEHLSVHMKIFLGFLKESKLQMLSCTYGISYFFKLAGLC
jgi:hypothetical protein